LARISSCHRCRPARMAASDRALPSAVRAPVLHPPWNRHRVLPGVGHLRQNPDRPGAAHCVKTLRGTPGITTTSDFVFTQPGPVSDMRPENLVPSSSRNDVEYRGERRSPPGPQDPAGRAGSPHRPWPIAFPGPPPPNFRPKVPDRWSVRLQVCPARIARSKIST
jgi:hypothetical protein